MVSFTPSKMFTHRRLSRSSQSSGGSVSSAKSAASNMSEQELDNFRSMRGKSSLNTEDVSHNMTDDVFDLDDRLVDIQKRKEIERRVVDITGQAYSILVTATDVRLQHVDDKGHYHYNHFGSEKPAKHARNLGQRRDPELVKQQWAVLDDEETGHVFVHITPKVVTVHHADGTWQMRRISGFVITVEDTVHRRPASKKIPRPGGANVRKKSNEIRVFRLYGLNDDTNTTKDPSDSPKVEALLCANTPGEKGVHHRAHQSYYHDL